MTFPLHTASLLRAAFAALLLAAAGAFPSGVVHAQRILTLDEARASAAQNAEEIAIARLGVREAERGIDAVRAQRLPRLDLSASYTHVSETASIDFSIPGVLSRSISFGDGNVYETALTASVPLFTGFRLQSAQRLQESRRDIAVTQLQGSTVALHNRVTAAYHQAQLAMRTRSMYDGQLAYLADQLDVLRKLEAQGQLLPYDTLLLSTRMSALRVERASADAAYRNALLQIADISGVTEDFDVDAELPPLPAFRNDGAAQLSAAAIEHRADLAALRRLVSAGADRVSSEQAGMLPSLSAFASYRYGRPGVDQITNDWMPYYTAGIALQWNLFRWGGDRARVEQQEIAMQEEQLRYDRLRRQIENGMRGLLNDLGVLEQTMAMLDDQIRQEQAKRDLLQARLAQGLATATELVDDETALTTALLRREQSGIQYRLKLTEIANAAGVAI